MLKHKTKLKHKTFFFLVAVSLNNGDVLKAGGIAPGNVATNATSRYVAALGTWTAVEGMNSARKGYAIVALQLPGQILGHVLAAGGLDENGNYLATSEVFNATTNTWTATGSMATARRWHTLTALANGNALVAGGTDSAGTVIATCELFNAATGLWTPTGSMATARAEHQATLLASNGFVIVYGGQSTTTGSALSAAEIYNTTAGTWYTVASLNTARTDHLGILLPNGLVLVVGGQDSMGTYLSTAEVFNVTANTWSFTSNSMAAAHSYANELVLLPNQDVLISGGDGTSAPIATAELYDCKANLWSSTANMNVARQQAAAVLLPNGLAYIIEGCITAISSCPGGTSSTEYYDQCGNGTFGASCTSCAAACNAAGTASCVSGVAGYCSCLANWNGTATCSQCAPGYIGPNCTACTTACPHGSTSCVSGTSGYCVCPVNWNGTYCDQCASGYFGSTCNSTCSQCQNSASCASGINGHCNCPANWNGSALCDQCSTGYFGANCSSTCSSCLNGATCTSGLSGYCNCTANWNGTYCDQCALGYFGPSCTACSACENGGWCVQGIYGRCVCPLNWSGTLCSDCATNFYGPACQACPNNCSNGGQCNDGIYGSGACNCTFGYTGPSCANASCEVVGCNSNGICLDSGICSCILGWAGDFCTIQQACQYNSCRNGGNCVILTVNNFAECVCQPGYIGAFCETPTGCLNETCVNGGTCVAVNATNVACSCPAGYFGDYCEIPQLCRNTSTPCENGGACIAINATDVACSCPAGYLGDFCDQPESCRKTPCANNGTCTTTTTTGNVACSCLAGFVGSFCEQADGCRIPGQECLNGGVCSSVSAGSSAVQCFCPPGYVGTTCATSTTTSPEIMYALIGTLGAICVVLVAVSVRVYRNVYHHSRLRFFEILMRVVALCFGMFDLASDVLFVLVLDDLRASNPTTFTGLFNASIAMTLVPYVANVLVASVCTMVLVNVSKGFLAVLWFLLFAGALITGDTIMIMQFIVLLMWVEQSQSTHELAPMRHVVLRLGTSHARSGKPQLLLEEHEYDEGDYAKKTLWDILGIANLGDRVNFKAIATSTDQLQMQIQVASATASTAGRLQLQEIFVSVFGDLLGVPVFVALWVTQTLFKDVAHLVVQILSLQAVNDFNVIVVLSLLATLISAAVNMISFVTFYVGPRFIRRVLNGGNVRQTFDRRSLHESTSGIELAASPSTSLDRRSFQQSGSNLDLPTSSSA